METNQNYSGWPKMTLVLDLDDIEKDVLRLKNKVVRQQGIYYTLIDGMVRMQQRHRIAKNYAVSDELRGLLHKVGVKIKQGTDGYAYDDIPESLRGMTVNDQWTVDD